MMISANIIFQAPVFINVSYCEYFSIEMLQASQRSCLMYSETTMKMFVTLLMVSRSHPIISLFSKPFLLISNVKILTVRFITEKNTTE